MKSRVSRIDWQYHRLVNSVYPPIDLFEDIADPEDWDLLAPAEGKTNPRLADTIGNLGLVPAGRRAEGANASYVMARFTHVSLDRAGRFHDGTFGAFYGANGYETALFETVHHQTRFCRATAEAPGWIADFRELIGRTDADLIDLRGGGFDEFLDPDDYDASQRQARAVRDDGGDGIVYPSVRHDGGECFAAFYPDVMGIPIQARHIIYHWNGRRIDRIKDLFDNHKVYDIRPDP